MAPAGTTQAAAAAKAKVAAAAEAADTTVTMELASTLRLVIGRLDRRLRQHAIGGLTASQLSALAAIERHGPLPLGKLAKLEGVSPPTLTGIVGRLAERELVQREQDQSDARSTVVSVTDEGHRTLEAVRTERTAFLVRHLERLAPAERQALAAAVPILAGLLEKPEASTP